MPIPNTYAQFPQLLQVVFFQVIRRIQLLFQILYLSFQLLLGIGCAAFRSLLVFDFLFQVSHLKIGEFSIRLFDN